MVVIILLLFVILIAGFSIGMAALLYVFAGHISLQWRAMLASILGASVLMLVPLTALVIDGKWNEGLLIGVTTMIVGTLILAGLLGFAPAYWLSKKLARLRDPDVFR